MSEYQPTIAHFSQIITCNLHNAAAFFERGQLHEADGNYPPAIADYSEAIRLEPHNSDFFYQRGNLHRKMKAYEPALADFAKAVRLNPDQIKALVGQANVLFVQKQYEPRSKSTPRPSASTRMRPAPSSAEDWFITSRAVTGKRWRSTIEPSSLTPRNRRLSFVGP